MKPLKHYIKNRTHLANIVAAERRKGTQELALDKIWQDGLDFLAERKADNARKKKLSSMWHEHLVPLKDERKRVIASLAYRNHNQNNADPRQMALKAYRKVIDELLRRMESAAQDSISPIEYAKQNNASNNGEHWTDFVPVHIKQRVCQMFDEVPHTPKAKRKVPFERVVGAEIHNLQKVRLTRRTEKELVKCKQDLLINPHDEDKRERIKRIESALKKIDTLEMGEFVPTTWQGLY